MTVKKTSEDQVAELAWGKGTKAYRLLLMGVALAATPIGQNILKSVGITAPAVEQTVAMQADMKSIKDDIGGLKTDAGSLKSDMMALKANNAILNAKVDTLDQTFQGFRIDFNKMKPKEQ